LVPVELPIEDIRVLVDEVAHTKGQGLITVDLEALTVTSPSGKHFSFNAPPALREMLLHGMDEIALTLSQSSQIDDFRQTDRTKRPWAYFTQ
jgi:3-isopropylmalate/(R)-2-methylmalate dehydratase small subunit